jgi:hypothetical protein
MEKLGAVSGSVRQSWIKESRDMIQSASTEGSNLVGVLQGRPDRGDKIFTHEVDG